ncbi:helix-turn-helix domain-containing protein [Ruminococcus gauvreauii]|uniref:XRE family transcriptional regulator n=1 Tax=Ruminococcus gauvreauii TaxID=438033 RepID=A0ABY5VEA1_9FIRM|nr:helix-turn-helix transcriptional regulator [Ruminococcus gauvreauii]UWP58597.1 XRE family transcriptional regulator [Ruminococcus gauvreauii]
MDYRKIKEIMKDRKYTLEELSELSGIPLSTLSKITSGITPNPRYDTMAAIAQALNCSLDEFSETAPKISYTFKKYSSKFEALPPYWKNYITFNIDLEYNRLLHKVSKDKILLKCFEFFNPEVGRVEYSIRITRNLVVDCNSLTAECTFGIILHTNKLSPSFFKHSILGFQYADWIQPKNGEIWLFLHNGYLIIGRFYRKRNMMLLKSLTDTQHDLVMTDPNDYKRMGRYLGVIPFPENFSPG